MFFFMVAGKRTSIRTRLSHGQTKIDNWLLGEIAKQVHLSKQDLNQFIECEMTQEAYLRKMIDDGHVRLDDPPVKTIRR